jgi:hypothetical protein
MKYLKFYKLFENFYIEDFINELKEVSEMYLAYLLDDNNIEVGVYEYQFIDEYNFNQFGQRIVIEVYTVDDKNIKWDKLKDHLIPFVEIINKKYKLVPENTDLDDEQVVLLWDNNSENTPFTIEELKSHPIKEISGISIYVKYNNEI